MKFLLVLFAMFTLTACASVDWDSLCNHAPEYVVCVTQCVQEPQSIECITCVASIGGDILEVAGQVRESGQEGLTCPLDESPESSVPSVEDSR